MNRPVKFIATESGFEDGMGGASNAAGTKDYHYVLFGRQTDEQHSERSGVYFEFDDQIHGSVNSVTRVLVADDVVRFELRGERKIVVRRGMGEPQWSRFVRGIYDAFSDDIVHKA